MPIFNFTVFGTVKVPEGVSADDINIIVSPVFGEKEEKIPDENWDVHEVNVVED